MVSIWTEFLRLTKIADHAALLEICMYEGLGELQRSDDDDDDVPLPDEIDGKRVMGVDDGIIFGGELVCYEFEKQYSYEQLDIDGAVNWLKSQNWQISTSLIEELKKAVA